MASQQHPEIPLTGVRNFRDVGGLPAGDGRRVRTGRLFRSGHLAEATDGDRAFLSGLRLRVVFDFRNAADHALQGRDVALPGVRNVNLPLTDAADGTEFWQTVREGSMAELRAAMARGRAEADMRETYRALIRERTAELGRVLHTLAAGGTPALLHCAAGKDRAGVTMAVILLALDVDREAILADYLRSNAPQGRFPLRRDAPAASEGESEEVARLLAPLFDARAEYLQAAFDAVDDGWGGVDGYLTSALALAPEVRDRLRADLLTAG